MEAAQACQTRAGPVLWGWRTHYPAQRLQGGLHSHRDCAETSGAEEDPRQHSAPAERTAHELPG